MTLRLLVDLYHVQNLREDGGINRALIWQGYERIKVGDHAQFVIWGFRSPRSWVNLRGPLVCHRAVLSDENDPRESVTIISPARGNLRSLAYSSGCSTWWKALGRRQRLFIRLGVAQAIALKIRLGVQRIERRVRC